MQLDALQSLALSVAQARSPDSVLTRLVQGLGMWAGVALARVWLLREGDAEPPYLQLKASIGASALNPAERWNRTDGAHHKIPIAYGKVGYIAANNRPLLLQRGRAIGWSSRTGRRRRASKALPVSRFASGALARFSSVGADALYLVEVIAPAERQTQQELVAVAS